MAKQVKVQVFGGDAKTFDDVHTVADAKARMNVPGHTATVNGESASNGDSLSDYDFVALAPSVKGAGSCFSCGGRYADCGCW